MNDAPPAPLEADLLRPDEVEFTIENDLRLFPDSILRRVVGAPLGTVTIAGVRCSFRRASVRDCQKLEPVLGKKFEEAIKGGDRVDLCRIARFALTPLDGEGDLPEDGADLPWGELSKLVAVVRFFSGPGTLVGRSGAPSPKTPTAGSNGPAGP